MRTFRAECEDCGMLLEISKLDREIEVFRGEKVTVISYTCPKCDKKHVTSVYDEESDNLRKRLKDVHTKEERVVLERNMYYHNSKLKKAYLKDVRKYGKERI